MKTGKTMWMVSALTALLAAAVSADPLAGQQLLFAQRPMVETNWFGQIYYGHDEASTAVQLPLGAPFDAYAGPFMADDFAIRSSQPITHLKFWGGYRANPSGESVRKFFISFESDVPQGPNVPFSRPGEALLSQIVTAGALSAGSGTFTEKLIRPRGGPPTQTPLFEYNAELETPFVAAANTVYWLKVVALTEPAPPNEAKFEWGWHNRDYTIEDELAPTAPAVVPGETGFFSPIPEVPPIWHFQDDAVSGVVRIDDFLFPGPGRFHVTQTEMAPQRYVANADGAPFIAEFSKDLAFEIYGVPEPSTMLVALGGAVMVLIRRRRDVSP